MLRVLLAASLLTSPNSYSSSRIVSAARRSPLARW
jgi:hypothetical protein